MRAMFILTQSKYDELIENSEIAVPNTLEEDDKELKFFEYYSSVLRKQTQWEIPFNVPLIGFIKHEGTRVWKSLRLFTDLAEGVEDPVYVYCKIPNEDCLSVNAEIFTKCYNDVMMGYVGDLKKFKLALRYSHNYTYATAQDELLLTPIIKVEYITEVRRKRK